MKFLRLGVATLLLFTFGPFTYAGNDQFYEPETFAEYLTSPLPDSSPLDKRDPVFVSRYWLQYKEDLANRAHQISPGVRQLANLGLAYFDFYLAQLRQDFPATTLKLLFHQETEILRRLQEWRESRWPRFAEKPLSELEMKSTAWSKTISRFSLPQAFTLDQLIKKSLYDFRSAQALEFYRDELERLERMTKRQKLMVIEPNVNDFKLSVSKSLLEARGDNFRLTARLADPQRTWEIQAPQSTFQVSAADLKDARVNFERKKDPGTSLVSRFTPQNDGPGRLRSLGRWIREGEWINEKLWGQKLSSLFIDPTLRAPTWPLYQVRITIPGGKSWIFSEEDFSRLLGDLRPVAGDNPLSGPDRHFRSYVGQATFRDQVLADLNVEMIQTRDASPEDLEKRLRGYINQNSALELNGSVERLVQILGEDHVRSRTTCHLYLSGIMIDPDFWTLRRRLFRQLQKETSLLSYRANQVVARNFKQDKAQAVREYFEKQMREWFFGKIQQYRTTSTTAPAPSSPSEASPELARRRTLMTWKTLQYAALAGSVAWGADYFTGGELFGPVQSFLARPTSTSTPSANVPSAQQAAHPPLSMSSDDSSHNFADSPGGNPDYPMFRIIHHSDGPSAPAPKYFNLANNYNLPREALRGQTSAAVREMKLPFTGFVGPRELLVESANPSLPNEGRFAIVQIPGYRIEKLTIMNNGRALETSAYRVFEVTASGLTYAQVESDSQSFYTYRAQYRVEEHHPSPDPVFMKMEKAAMAEVKKEIDEGRFTEISKWLEAYQQSGQSVSAHDLALSFALASEYSSRAPHLLNPKLFFNPFFYSSQYLHEGRLYYQCTGAAEFANSYFNSYIQHVSVSYKDDLFAQNVRGYVWQGGQYVMHETAHEHLLIGRYSRAHSAVDIDPTPGREQNPFLETSEPSMPKPAPPPPEPSAKARPETNTETETPSARKEASPAPAELRPLHHGPKPAAPLATGEEPYALRPRVEPFRPIKRVEVQAEPPKQKMDTPREEPKAEPVAEGAKALAPPPDDPPARQVRSASKSPPPPPPVKRWVKKKVRQITVNEVLMNSLKKAVLDQLEIARRESPTLNRVDPTEIPGIEILSMTKDLVRWSQDKIEEAEFFDNFTKTVYRLKQTQVPPEKLASTRDLLLQKGSGEEAWAIGQTFKDSAARFENYIESMKRRLQHNPADREPYTFLMDPRMRDALRNYYAYINSLNWFAPPKFIMVEVIEGCNESLRSQ